MLGLLPRLPVPGAVLEVIAGIVIGPSVLGWVRADAPVQVLSDLGLGMLLFLAGLEIDVERLCDPLARLAGLAFGVSAVLGLLAAFIFRLAGQGPHPLLLAIIFRTGTRRAAAAGLLQATTLTFVIVATQIGLATGMMTPTVAAALVAAGLLSAALFPGGALRLLSPAKAVRSTRVTSSARAVRRVPPRG